MKKLLTVLTIVSLVIGIVLKIKNLFFIERSNPSVGNQALTMGSNNTVSNSPVINGNNIGNINISYSERKYLTEDQIITLSKNLPSIERFPNALFGVIFFHSSYIKLAENIRKSFSLSRWAPGINPLIAMEVGNEWVCTDKNGSPILGIRIVGYNPELVRGVIDSLKGVGLEDVDSEIINEPTQNTQAVTIKICY